MTNLIIRLGVYFLACANLVACTALAQNPLPKTVTANVSNARTVTAKIVLKEDVVQLLAAEKPDLGVVRAGEVLKVEFDVVNGTERELIFDRIVSNHDRAQPNQGRIRPGESMKVSFHLHASPRPRSQDTGNFIEFHCNDGKAGYVYYGYSFATYVGVAQDFVTVPLQESGPISQARFDVPLVIGGKLKEGDFEVSLEGIDGEFEARIDSVANSMHCLVRFAEPLEADRCQAKIVILDLASGFIRETPIVFERPKEVEILPTYLEFIPDDHKEGYVAMLYIWQNTPNAESKFQCVVELSASGVPIASKVSRVQHDLVLCRVRISNDHLEKLAELSSQTNGESQPPTQSRLEISVTTNDSKIAATIPFSIRGQPAIQAGAINKLFVTDAIHTGMLAMLSLSPFDVYGVTTEEKEFEDEARHETERVKFRLSFDRENQLLVYAAETKPDRKAVLRGADPTGTESVSYHRFIINGNLLYNSSSLPIRPRTLASFEQALQQIPQPAFWGVTTFPGSSSTPKVIERLAIEAGSKDCKVMLTAVEQGLRISFMLEEEGNPMAGISIWEYGLPRFHPTQFQRIRMVDGSPSKQMEQTIVWSIVQGHEVPTLVTSESVTLKRLEAEQPKFALGQALKDTQLVWLSFESGKSLPANQEISLHSPKEIKDFIDAGEQKAKSLGR